MDYENQATATKNENESYEREEKVLKDKRMWKVNKMPLR